MRLRLALPMILVMGCAGGMPMATAPSDVDASPAAARAAARILAGAHEDLREVVDVPPLGSWPITYQGKGPLYALFQVSPYVGQLGILADADRADTGAGFGLTFGYRMPMGGANSLSADFIFEQSAHTNESAGVDATASRILVAGRLTMGMDSSLNPFVAVGVGQYTLAFDGVDPDFNLQGLGVLLGGGVDYSPAPALALRAELGLHIWDAAEVGSGNGGMAETLAIAIGAAFSF